MKPNVFLKVDKDLFNKGLNPTQILIVAQIMEFNTNTGDCFISDKTLAENFGVSESTIKREIKKLEELGYIVRETKNVRGGKERHMKANVTKLKMSLDEDLQSSNCSLTSVKLSFDKEQNDTIKDNIQDKEKDNNSLLPKGNKLETATGGSFVTVQEAEQVKAFSELSKAEQIAKFKAEVGF